MDDLTDDILSKLNLYLKTKNEVESYNLLDAGYNLLINEELHKFLLDIKSQFEDIIRDYNILIFNKFHKNTASPGIIFEQMELLK